MMFAVLLSSFAALAQDGGRPVTGDRPPMLAREAEGLGVGVILGAPTGLSFGWRTGGPLSYDAAVAWSFSRGSLSTHADARLDLWDAGTEDFPDMSFPLYVGVGPRVRIGDVVGDGYDADFDLGVRIPFGMSIRHAGMPIEGFVELVPGVGIFPSTTFLFDAALGLRLYVPVEG